MAKEPEDDHHDADLGGDYARDTHRGGFGDDYAREDHSAPAGARGDNYGTTEDTDLDESE